MAQPPKKQRLVIVGRGVPPVIDLKNVPTWTRRDELGRKTAQTLPAKNGIHIRLFDEEAILIECFVRYEKLVEEADSAVRKEK